MIRLDTITTATCTCDRCFESSQVVVKPGDSLAHKGWTFLSFNDSPPLHICSSCLTGLDAFLYEITAKRAERLEEIAAELREVSAADIREYADRVKAHQNACSHHHETGETYLVAIHQDSSSYLICQLCQVHIPSDHPKYVEWFNEFAIAKFTEDLLNPCVDLPVTPDEEKLYALSTDELRAMGEVDNV